MSRENYAEGLRERLARTSPVSGDILTVWLFVAAAYAVAFLDVSTTVALPVATILIFFLPGYVVAAALFPRRGDRSSSFGGDRGGTRITLRERVGVSLVVSIALVPLFGLILGMLGIGFSTTTVLHTYAAFLLIVGMLAAGRRLQVPTEDRFTIPVGSWAGELRTAVTTGSRPSRMITIALLCSIVLAAGVATFAIATPMSGESYSDFHLVTEEDGEYVSANYPEELVEGEPMELAWGVHNFEGETVDYTVVVTLERVTESDGEQRTVESEEVHRDSVTLGHDERTVVDHEIVPTLIGEDLRLNYYLYVGEPPEEPDRDSAYRHLHIWIDVDSN